MAHVDPLAAHSATGAGLRGGVDLGMLLGSHLSPRRALVFVVYSLDMSQGFIKVW